MAEYQQLKSSTSSAIDSTESRVFSDDELIEVDDFASFKGYTPKDMESLMVNFSKEKPTYHLGQNITVNFFASSSVYQMKPDDVIGICPLRKSIPFISKPLSECPTETNSQSITAEFFNDPEIVVKKVTLKVDSLSAELAKEYYFQFAYLTSNNDVIGVSSPFRFNVDGQPSTSAIQSSTMDSIEVSQITATTQAIEGIGENYDSMVMEKRDDDDFIVVRSQESFLKERVEHLAKSNSLLEYLIRSLEKDLSNKTVELQQMISKLDGEKAHSVKVSEDNKKILAKLEAMVIQNEELKKKEEDLKQFFETEQIAKKELQAEFERVKASANKIENTVQTLQSDESELKKILNDKEEEISIYKDMISNLQQANDDLNKKFVGAEEKMVALQSSLAKALNDYRDLQTDYEKFSNYEALIDENEMLKRRVQDLDNVKSKQASEIKTLEDELRTSVQNLNNLDSKIQAEREAISAKEQKYTLLLDKTKFELIEMHARLEQSRVEYANLYRKNQFLQKEVTKCRDRQSQSDVATQSTSASRSIGTLTTAAGPSKKARGLDILVPTSVKDSMDEIDLRLQQLEKDMDAQKPEVEAVLEKAKAVEEQLQAAASPQDSLLIDIESGQNQDAVSIASTVSEPLVQANTSPKTLLLSPSAPPAPQKNVVSIPCIMCDQVIECRQHEDGSGQMHEMVNHLEQVHHQKMCPVCSTLFDTRLPIFSTYFANHIQNHFNNVKYPNLN